MHATARVSIITARSHPITKSIPDVSTNSPTAKPTLDHVEQIHTNERVPGHSNYYEKDGLRTYGDGEDHESEPKMTFARMMSLIAMAFRKQRCTFHTSGQVLTCR
jgi:hypothetical protein